MSLPKWDFDPLPLHTKQRHLIYSQHFERGIVNEKTFLILFAVFSLLFITACGSDSNKEENNDHRDGTVTSSVISVYDEEMNMVGSYSYSATVNNTIDVSAFQKEGYKFDGIFDINLGIMLFNSNGFQAPTVMLDTNYNAVLRYSPITFQLVFEANEGQLENSLDYIRNISADSYLRITDKDGVSWWIYYVPALSTESTDVTVYGNEECYEISGNNMDGFIVTINASKLAE